MSDRPTHAASGDALFKNTDEQERIYAPQQVPGTDLPGEERDVGGTAGQSTGQARADTGDRDDRVAGAEGNEATVPIVGVRPDVSAAAPMPLPATNDADLDQDATR